MPYVMSSHPAPPGAPPPRTGRGGRWSRGVRRLAAVVALVTGAALAGPGTAGAAPTGPMAAEARTAAALERVTAFGANPGNLNMYVHRPPALPADAPVVVALHGCTQSAQMYSDNSGLDTFADRHGFLVVYAETTTANNANKCFNWFQPGDTRRGQGEAASIRQMVAHAATAYGTDVGQVHVTGLSAGGAMTSVMLAAYPEVFAAGAVVAGIPYGCGVDVVSAFGCMSPGKDRTPAAWAQAVRDARPGFTGPWPRVAIWHGDNDPTVVPRNADELRDQWTAVHGLGQSPDRTSTVGPNSTRRSSTCRPGAGASSRSTGYRGSLTALRSIRAPAASSAAPPAPSTSSTRSAPATGSPASSAWTAAPSPNRPWTRPPNPAPAGRPTTTSTCARAGPPPPADTCTRRAPASSWGSTTPS